MDVAEFPGCASAKQGTKVLSEAVAQGSGCNVVGRMFA